MPIIRSTRVQSWTPARGATVRYQAFDLQNVKIAPMDEFSTHHLDQSRQDNARHQSQWLPVMHANQPYPGKLHQAVTKTAYEMQHVHEVENYSWLIDLKATALYILLSRDLGNYWPTRIYIWNNKLHSGVYVGAQLMSLQSQITSISCRVETPH